MDYLLTSRQEEIRALARRLANEHVRPVRAELDERGEFPHGPLRAFADAGLSGLWAPEELGGTSDGMLGFALAVEEIARVCAGVSTSFAADALAAMPIVIGDPDVAKKYVPEICAGKMHAAFCLTEAQAGSDAAAVQTAAVKDGDSYVLNGRKQWSTNGTVAEIFTVFAMTDPSRGSRGATAFVVERDMPGIRFGTPANKMGIRASQQAEIFFEDCRVPAANRIGKEGMGFVIAMKTLDHTRPGIGAQSVGLAQGALDEALAYAQEREQFGQAIVNFQIIQHMLADMAIKIEAARALVYATARMIDAGKTGFGKDSAMAKVLASDVAMEVTTDACQILGGYGYMKEYPTEKMMRDAKIQQIYEGTNQIQRNIIARHLIKESRR